MRSFSSQAVAWSLIVSLVLPCTLAFADDEEDRLTAEAERIEQAYKSFSEGDLDRMRGSGVIGNVIDSFYDAMEAMPVVGEAARQLRDTDSTGFTETELAPYTVSGVKNSQRLMKTLFRETLGFHQRVAASNLPPETKAKLMSRANAAFRESFARLSAHFDNYIPGPESLAERRAAAPAGAGNQALTFIGWAGEWLLHKGQYILREITMLFKGEAIPFPLLQGRSERRSDVVEALASEVRVAVRADLARVRQLNGGRLRSPRDLVLAARDGMRSVFGNSDDRDAEQVAMSLVATEELLRAVEDSETAKLGHRQRIMRRVYFGLAFLALYFGGPEVGPIFGWDLGLRERTEIGPVLAMIQWTSTALWLARSRRQNSGLDLHKSLYGGATPLVGRRGLIAQVEKLTASPVLADHIDTCRAVYAASL